ncbi:WD repeat-containing protein 13 [Balamuthia mandrillaris]
MAAKEEDAAALQMQGLAATAILEQVLQLDAQYAARRECKDPSLMRSLLHENEEDPITTYLRWRGALLKDRALQGTFIHMKEGDRRDDYLSMRRAFLANRFPPVAATRKRNATKASSKQQRKQKQPNKSSKTKERASSITSNGRRRLSFSSSSSSESSSDGQRKKRTATKATLRPSTSDEHFEKRGEDEGEDSDGRSSADYHSDDDRRSTLRRMASLPLKRRSEEEQRGKRKTSSETTTPASGRRGFFLTNSLQQHFNARRTSVDSSSKQKQSQKDKTKEENEEDEQKEDDETDNSQRRASTEKSNIKRERVGQAYEFTGMHHLFAHHSKAVTTIRFAHEDKDLLALASMDGDVSLCSAFESPCVLATFRGHTNGVMDLDWSMSNDFLLSASMDGSVRVWSVETRKQVRSIISDDASACRACRFHPLNTNLFVFGTNKGFVNAVNLSTGKTIQQLNIRNAVTSLEFETTGTTLFVGDAKGFVHIFRYNFSSGAFLQAAPKQQIIASSFSASAAFSAFASAAASAAAAPLSLPAAIQAKTSSISAIGSASTGGNSSVNSNSKDCAITSLRFKAWFSSQAGQRTPELVCACQDGTLKLLSMREDHRLEFTREYKVPIKNCIVRTCFCPLISIRDGSCVVVGGEDMTIYIINVKEPSPAKAIINKLQGHSAPVLDVAWNYDESLLASCDASGLVILWKRIKMQSKKQEVETGGVAPASTDTQAE